MIEPNGRSTEWRWTPTPAQLLRFSAVTWNPHLIHVSREHALRYGLEDVVVHSQLPATVVSSLAARWLGRNWRLASISWENRAPAYVSQELRIVATCELVEGDAKVDVAAWRPDGTMVLHGRLVFELPSRERDGHEEDQRVS